MFTKRFSKQVVHLCLAAARPALVAFVALAAFAGLLLLLSPGPVPVTAAAAMMPPPLDLSGPAPSLHSGQALSQVEGPTLLALTPTTTTLSISPPSPQAGEEVTLTASVNPTAATGVVSFDDGGTEIGRAALSGGQAVAKTSRLATGVHKIKALYWGDGTYAASESDVTTLTVAKGDTVVTVTGPDSSYYAESSVTFEATVTSSAAGTPTGKVVFKGWGDDFETVLYEGKASFTPSEPHDVGGPFDITAEYKGDANFNGSSGTKSHTVTKADTKTELKSPLPESDYGQEVQFIASVSADPQGAKTPTGKVDFYCDGITVSGCVDVSLGSPATCRTSDLIVGTHDITATYKGDANFDISTSDTITHTVNKTASETSLESSANPSDYGQTVTFTATVKAAGMGSGTPTGTVTFKDGGAVIPGCGTVPLASAATCTKNDLSAGSHDITAEYSGDANFDGSSDRLTQTVNKRATTTTLTSSHSPANTSVVSETVTFTATITGSIVPTGTVSFFDGTTVLDTKTLVAGVATLTTSSLSAGLHVMKAVYNGTPNFNSSTSSRLLHTVSAASSTTTLTSSSNPSVYGQNVTFQATVASASGTPTGQVTFKDGAATLGTGTLVAGVATFSTSTLTVGTHPITAVYGGDATFTGSTSNQVDQVVNKANTTTTITSDLPDPSVVGEPVLVNFTVVANAPSGGTPSGNVTVSDGTASCVGTVAAGTCTLIPTTAGAKTLTATYAGSSNFNGSAGTTPHQVNPAATTTTVTSSPNPSLPDQNVTITANVAANPPGAGTPTGSVTFKDGGIAIGGCSSVALTSGSASCTTSFSSVGTHPLTAEYNNVDGNFNNSTGAVSHNVSTMPTDLSVTKADSPDPVNAGDNLTYIIHVANHGPQPTDVTLTDTLPPQVTFVSATPSQGSCNEAGGTVTCNLVTMASGGSATVTIVVNVPLTTPAGTVLRNTAQVNGTRPDSDLSDNTSTAETTVYRAPRLGDCNGDDTVSLADIWSIVRDIFDPTFVGTSGCDANQDRRVDAGDVPSTVLIMFRSANAASMGGGLHSVTGPALTMPEEVQAVAGQAIVPLTFAANGHSITSLAFSVDYDETWLALDPTDRDGNGVPDAVVFSLPGDFTYSVTFDEGDADGEVDIFIGDITPPLTSLSDGPFVFMLLDADSSPGGTQGAVRFSLDPAASFGDTSGQSIPGTATPTGRYPYRIYLPVTQ